MSEEKLSSFYDDRSKNYHSRTDILKFLLIPFVFFVLLGFPGKYGGYISTYSNFVPQVFFILFGFFTLVPDQSKRNKKLRRALRNAFELFVIMFLCYMVLNIIYFAYYNSLRGLFSSELIRKRTLFNFLVLNVWPLPMGSGIWFVQSLVYAYLFFLLAENHKLNKFYLPIFIVFTIFALATGEFAAFFGFPYYGYGYIPAGAVTRAIPYMLIGMFLRKNVDKLKKIPRFVYLLLFPVGLLAAIAELEFLNRIGKLIYLGHTIGFGIMALSLCCFAIAKPEAKKNFLSNHGMSYSRRMYALCQPVSFVCWIVTALINPGYIGIVRKFSCIISLIICFIISFFITLIKRKKYGSKKQKNHLNNIDK